MKYHNLKILVIVVADNDIAIVPIFSPYFSLKIPNEWKLLPE